ncbi:BsuPI-related putative proteinase inhibitor [Neobacillus drentensis]|uniref:BsuPI-related putative proteinase inhibitor n=1 Tax=Neobacillus drentensis TaxID=220684 RepID=UPI002FFE0172
MKKKLLLVITSALLVGLLSGCGEGEKTNASSEVSKSAPPNQNEIAANFLPEIALKVENGKTLVRYTVKNISGEPKKLTFRTGLEADYIVYDASGKKIKQYSDEVMSTQVIKEMILENNQTITKNFIITGLPNGKYRLEVFLTAKEEQAKAVTALTIKNTSSNGQ